MTEETPAPTIDVNYIKSAQYREVSCDGAVGGPTPGNKLWVGFYTERLPIPRVVQHTLKSSGSSGEFQIDTDVPPVPLDSRSGIIRNMEFGLYLTQDTAAELHAWLGRHLAGLRGE